MASRIPAETLCPLCSKPIRSGSLVLFEDGDLFHVTCRSRAYRLASTEHVAHARTPRRRAAQIVGDTAGTASRSARGVGWRRRHACPFCGHAAGVTDWQPVAPWIAVEGCPCSGFFVWAGLSTRLPTLTAATRRDFAARIRKVRAAGHEAWCTTADGTTGGTLVVRAEHPDRPT